MFYRSIRFKIVLWYMGLLTITLLVFSTLVYETFKKAMYDDLDDVLSIRAEGITNAISRYRDIKKMENYQIEVNVNAIGNTGAFLLIKKDLFQSLNGFPENYVECLEDVELNLKCKELGLMNITVSDAVAYHYESVSRDKSQDK